MKDSNTFGWIFAVLLLFTLYFLFIDGNDRISTVNRSNNSKPKRIHSKASKPNFKIIDCYGVRRSSDNAFRVIGEVQNIGDVSAGVQIEAIARDRNGRLVGSVKFWPNSVSNIPPNSSTGIGHTITKDHSATEMECRIVSTTVW